MTIYYYNNIGGSNPIQVTVPIGSSQLFIQPVDNEGRCRRLRTLTVELLQWNFNAVHGNVLAYQYVSTFIDNIVTDNCLMATDNN